MRKGGGEPYRQHKRIRCVLCTFISNGRENFVAQCWWLLGHSHVWPVRNEFLKRVEITNAEEKKRLQRTSLTLRLFCAATKTNAAESKPTQQNTPATWNSGAYFDRAPDATPDGRRIAHRKNPYTEMVIADQRPSVDHTRDNI